MKDLAEVMAEEGLEALIVKEDEKLNEIAVLDDRNSLQVFTADKGLDPYLKQIRDEIDSFVPDLTTDKGRKAIASLAAKVSKSKTALDKVGKDLVADLKKQPKIIDAERKRVRDTLDKWRDEARQPLTDWENAEKERVNGIHSRINAVRDLSTLDVDDGSAEISEKLRAVLSVSIDDSFHELQNYAQTTRDDSEKYLSVELEKATKIEAEKAELEQLKKEKADRDQKDHEEKLKRDAAEKARIDAEEEANKKIALAAQKAAAEADRKQKEIDDANEAFAKAIKDSEQAKKDAEAREAAAKLREEQAEERAKQKVIDEQKARDDAEREREADTKHKGAINRSVLESLVMIQGVSEELGKRIVSKLAKGKVPHTKISY